MTDTINIDSITEAHQLLGMEKPKHPLISAFPHMPSMSEYTDDIRITGELYMISMKEGISGTFNYGRNSYDFQEGTMTFIGPKQVFTPHQTTSSHNNQSWTLLFHPDLIRASDLGKNIHNYSFFSYEVHEALHISDDEKRTLTELMEKIQTEVNQNMDQHTQKLIIANLELLLDYCTRYYDRQFYTRSPINKDMSSRFEKLLKNYYINEQHLESGIPTVNYCGKELGVSPNYLSDLLKKETGRNARDHIHFFIIDQAKTELLRSKQPINQIAYNLGFEYPSHFTKMFKKNAGISPAEYRKLH